MRNAVVNGDFKDLDLECGWLASALGLVKLASGGGVSVLHRKKH